MRKSGLKIKNVKATTLLGYNNGIRDRYDYTDAMFNNSMFKDYMMRHKLKSYKGESTRDIICFDFDFGTRSYEEEIKHLENARSKAESSELPEDEKNAKISLINCLIKKVEENKYNFKKLSKDEVRKLFYKDGVSITYEDTIKHKDGTKETAVTTIHYKMLYRNASKAKMGQVMFINEELYDVAYDWLTMGLGNKMPIDNAKIVEMSAYAPLSTSTIIDKIHIPIEDVLILSDYDSFFETTADIVRSEDYTVSVNVIDDEKTSKKIKKAIDDGNLNVDGSPKYTPSYKKVEKTIKKCKLVREKTKVKNTIWDGMMLVDGDYFKSQGVEINGMALMRGRFFKACGLNTKLQLFFKDWCAEHGHDYNTYIVYDMFGVGHKLKDIKIVTTENSVKWKKFSYLMGSTLTDAYKYWCDKVSNEDFNMWGIVKTDHESKIGNIMGKNVQQMSYQMINTLPCTKEELGRIVQTSVSYVEEIKRNPEEFEKFLRRNANEINHYEMLADLYAQNHEFDKSKYFRSEKSKIISDYVHRFRKGKIIVEGDNLTVFGNPYALLLHAVGDFHGIDPTFSKEEGTIQCWTKRFGDDEYLAAFRNPHNSANNICYFHNVFAEEFEKYFNLSSNVAILNCIETDVQSRANGMDFDLTKWVSSAETLF